MAGLALGLQETAMFSNRRAPYARIRNVQRVRRPLSDGRCNYHHYHRPTRTKLPGQPGSPEFMAAYQECERRLKAERKPPDVDRGLDAKETASQLACGAA